MDDMNYKYYLGPSGAGKTRKIMQDMTEMALADKSHNYLLIVPDQYTMQAQKDMVEINPCKGIMNIDVLSFGRLYHKIMGEVGSDSQIILDDTGKNLLLRRVAIDIMDDLEYIGSSLDKPGFIHEVKSVISEFMQYGYSPDAIDDLIQTAGNGRKIALQKKLIDLKKLYAAFQAYKQEKYITSEETMGVLASSLGKADSLKDCVIAFDGFTGFTPIQKRVISALLRRSRELWFSVTIDKEALNSDIKEGDLFGLSHKTIAGINGLMAEAKAVHLSDVYLPEGESVPRFESQELAFLERNLFRNNQNIYESGAGEAKIQNLQMFVADNPREELKNVCIEIDKLVRTKSYAYRDIAIVTGALESYAPYVNDLFGLYDIPVFVDYSRKLILNPMIEYIRAGLLAVRKNFTYESVMHLLRSGVTGIALEDIDEFDNYITSLGIKGYKNYKNDFARFPKFLRSYDGKKVSITDDAVRTLGRINVTRRQIISILSPLMTIASGKHTATEISRCVYHFVADNDLYEKISTYAKQFEADQDMARKKEYDQVYREFMVLLDRIAGVIGEDELDLGEYTKILDAGISEIKIGVVPGQTDYVLFGDIERSRLKEIKVLFFVGINDGSIPKTSGGGGMISDLDREYLHRDYELAPTSREKMFTQRLYLYMNMTKPSEKLYMSYANTDALGQALKPSYLIETVKGMMPGLCIVYKDNHISMDNIYGKNDINQYLSELIRQYAAGVISEEDEKLFLAMYDEKFDAQNAAEKNAAEKNTNETNSNETNTNEQRINRRNTDELKKLRKAAFYKYEAKPIAREIVNALYGQVIVNSVSRLERYAGCAYSHFLQYGLKLAERENFDVSRMDIGNIYHEVMQRFAAFVTDHGIDWGQLDEKQAAAIFDEIYDSVVNSYGESLFFKDARSSYEIEKMKRVLLRTVDTVAFQVRKTSFRPKHFELEFKSELDLEKFKVGLTDDEKIKIRGKIDRVDTHEDSEAVYVKIVDYKSSNKKLDLIQLYNGLSLQLVIYLDQAVKEVAKNTPGKEVRPAAMYYYPVTLPLIENSEPQPEEAINAMLRDKLKLSGLSVNDDKLVELLGGEFEKSSEVISVSRTKAGFSKTSQLIDLEDMEAIMQYANRKTAEISKRILDGDIEARPCGQGACQYCPYVTICGYDTKTDGYRDNAFEDMSKDEVIDRIKEKLSEE